MANNFEFTPEVVARPYQIGAKEALNLNMIDLFKEEGRQGQKHLSRADIILISMLYPEGLAQFLKEYKEYAQKLVDEKGYKFVAKPHYYLKDIIG